MFSLFICWDRAASFVKTSDSVEKKNIKILNLKEQLTPKWKFSYRPLTPMLIESRVKFLTQQNILVQNSVVATLTLLNNWKTLNNNQ